MTLELINNRRREVVIYAIVWMIIYMVPVVNMLLRSYTDPESAFMWPPLFHTWGTITFFFVVFLIHDIFLAPIVVNKGNTGRYIVFTLLLVTVFQAYQCSHRPYDMPPPGERIEMPRGADLDKEQQALPRRPMEPNMKGPHGPGPNDAPLDAHDVLAFIIVMLMLGVNLSLKFYLKSRDAISKMEEIERQSLEQQLRSLKNQINPHFFMNTLNNIHALVDIDPEGAKQAVIELSKMMRYMLYESESSPALLSREIDFIRNYIELMRIRFSENVQINFTVPDQKVSDRLIEPLLLVSFVENAFKYGVSYTQKSEINITIGVEGDMLHFTCTNSILDPQPSALKGGIGIENTLKRLDLIYGDEYTYTKTEDNGVYRVDLELPFFNNRELERPNKQKRI